MFFTCLTVEDARVLVQALKARRIVREDTAVRVIDQIFCEFHEALGVVEDTAWKCQATSREWCEAAVIERILVTL